MAADRKTFLFPCPERDRRAYRAFAQQAVFDHAGLGDQLDSGFMHVNGFESLDHDLFHL